MPVARELILTVVDLGATYARGFATSLLAASAAVDGRDWLLCTPDHVFDVRLVEEMRRARLGAEFVEFEALALVEHEPVDRNRRV